MSNLSKRLTLSGFIRSASIVIMAGIAFFSMPIMIRNLGNNHYSLWALVSTLISYCTLFDFGLTLAYQQSFSSTYGKEDTNELNRVFNTGIIIHLFLAVLVILFTVSLLFFTNSLNVDTPDIPLFKILLMIVGVTAALQIPERVAGGMLYTLVRHDLINLGAILESAVRMSLIIWGVTHGHGLLYIAIVSLVTNCCEYVWQISCALWAFPQLKINLKHFSFTALKRMLHYSPAAFVGTFAGSMKPQILPLLVAKFVAVDAIVFLSVAQRLLAYCTQFIASWSGMLTPVFGQLSHSQDRRLITTFTYTTTLITILSCYILLSVFMFSGPFIVTWLGNDYRRSVTILHFLVIPATIEFIMASGKEFLYGIAKHKGLAILHSVEVIGIIILTYFFHRYFGGVIGIVYAGAVVITPLELIVMPLLLSKHMQVSLFEMFKTPLFAALVMLLASGVFYSLFRHHVDTSYVSIILWNIIQLIIFTPIMFLVLPEKIQTLILQKLPNVFYSREVEKI